MEPYILDRGRKLLIARDNYTGLQFWSAKQGRWLGITEWRSRSKFRSREAAELELKRINLRLAPDVPKSTVRKA